jgi:hypothetical protein
MDPISTNACYPQNTSRLDDTNHPPPPETSATVTTPKRSDGCVRDDTPDADGCPKWVCANRYDFDAHVQATVVSPELFARNSPSDVDDITPADVRQNQMGDCHLMATLSALAGTPQGRALIRNAIAENRDAQGQVVSYSVALYERRPTPLGSALGRVKDLDKELGAEAVDAHHTLSRVTVTVDGKYACGHATAPESDKGTHEVWPVVLEKAIAQASGGYDAINGGSLSHRSMEMLTGQPASFHSLTSAWSPLRIVPGTYAPSDISAAVAAGKLVVLNTKPTLGSQGQATPYGLQSEHAYSVAQIVTVNGTPCALLRNPWGRSDPQPIPLDKLPDFFAGACVGSVN